MSEKKHSDTYNRRKAEGVCTHCGGPLDGRGHFWNGPGYVDEHITHWAEPMELPEEGGAENG